MPARIMVRTPERGSVGGARLRYLLGDNARLVRRNEVPRQYRTVINWGNTSGLYYNPSRVTVLNKPEAVRLAVDKSAAFASFNAAGVRHPACCSYLPQDREGIWLARTTTTSSGGEGIVVLREGDAIVEAPLYTKYIPKVLEYRLHVFGDSVFFAQQKRRERDVEQDRDARLIRNRHNGWVYAISEVSPTDDCKEQAVAAVRALGLDFGAVDIIVGRDDGLAYVLEINTAPGIVGTSTEEAYRETFCANITT